MPKQNKKYNEFLGIGSLLLATFIYSFFGILTRILGFTIPIFYQAWTRNLFCAVILLVPFLLNRKWKRVTKKDWKYISIRSFGGTIGFLGSYYAFYHIPIGTAYFIFYGGSTICGYILGSLLFREKLTAIKIFSLILSLVGLALIYFLNLTFANTFYMTLAFAAGSGAALWNTVSKKVSDTYSALQLNALDFVFSFLYFFVLSLLSHEQWVTPTLTMPWIISLLFAFLFITTGQLMIYGFARLEAQIGSLIMLTEVLFGIILGFLFFQETITLFTLTGGILVLIAIALPEIISRKK